ncbi:hypothetical protein KIL84_015486 [Mauremys mutica]|uniref:Uncharacterized protein n=1 Tax=Mauremys mutica TaxID=74926 RepID=A0A9D3WME6_9SAUR|nr:hypothetical protein KIL84_015486 [Mauremys mutica]
MKQKHNVPLKAYSMLSKMELSTIQMDRSWVSHLPQSRSEACICRTAAQMGPPSKAAEVMDTKEAVVQLFSLISGNSRAMCHSKAIWNFIAKRKRNRGDCLLKNILLRSEAPCIF